jgi:hypothetical protein
MEFYNSLRIESHGLSLISELVRLVEVHANWSGHP